MTSTRAYAFETVIAVRKGRGVIHLSQQAGTWATAPLFVQTLCGRPITTAGGWVEVQECATCQRCEKECADIDSARAFVIETDHAAALAEDAERAYADAAACVAAVAEYVCAEWEYGELRTRHYVRTDTIGTDSEDGLRPTDGARWSENPYDEASDYSGMSGGAETYCGRRTYGVLYLSGNGPAATCPECDAARASDEVVANVVPEAQDAMRVFCPVCGAAPYFPCEDPSCSHEVPTHAERFARATEAQDAAQDATEAQDAAQDVWADGFAESFGVGAHAARVAESVTRELTESEYDAVSYALRTAIIDVCDRFGLVANFDACDRIADDATNALSRHGIRH